MSFLLLAANSREKICRGFLVFVHLSFEFPAKRITVNLAPADLPKEGGRFDLPIALGILAASEQIPTEILQTYEIVGELALSGEVRPCQGILPLAIAARTSGRGRSDPRRGAVA